MSTISIASVQFDLKAVASDEEFWERVEGLCRKAKDQGAELVLFPEYFAMSLLLFRSGGDFRAALRGFAAFETEFHKRWQRLADSLKLVLVAGSVPAREKAKLVNRSFVYFPKRRRQFQDKQFMTRFEDETWKISSGRKSILSFKHKGATIGIAICFDVEFPRYAEKLVAKNVDVILVPSCTDDVHGYWRVRHCSEARAIESQSYVAMSSIVGGDPRYPEIFPHHGQVAFAGPCDVGFPLAGKLFEGEPNVEAVYVMKLDLMALKRVRKSGTVLNRKNLARRRSS